MFKNGKYFAKVFYLMNRKIWRINSYKDRLHMFFEHPNIKELHIGYFRNHGITKDCFLFGFSHRNYKGIIGDNCVSYDQVNKLYKFISKTK